VSDQAPEIIAINHDDYYAKHVGWTADDRQFFLTTPFIPATRPGGGREFLALYLFDEEGNLLEARIDDLGTRAELDIDQARRLRDQWLQELDPVEFDDIEVKPFQLDRFGTTFGLSPHPPEEEDEDWWVTVEPGDYMAFNPPWDGQYDT
jgi:hypothetical protein